MILALGFAVAGCDEGGDDGSAPVEAAEGGGKADDVSTEEGEPGYAALPRPGLYDVTGVSSDDILNIRAEPTTSSPIVGGLAPDEVDVEVVSTDHTGRWALINIHHDGQGWVSTAYLERQEDTWTEGELPKGLNCVGTEPFWGLYAEPAADTMGTLQFEMPGERRSYEITQIQTPAGFSGGYDVRTTFGVSDDSDITFTVTPGLCSDGASDLLYGYQATVITYQDEPAFPVTYSGCCTLSPFDAE